MTPTYPTGRTGPARRGGRGPARTVLAGSLAAVLGVALGAAPAQADPPPPSTEDPATWSFDMGTTSSAVADGWTGVDETNRYSEEAGYGIVPADGVTPISRDRGGEDPATRDFVLATDWQFLLDLPDGAYDVRVASGDLLTGTSSTRTTITLEGTEAGSLSTRQAVTEQTWRTEVTDGRLDVGITGAGAGGYVNLVQVTAAGATDPTDPADPTDPGSSVAAPTDLRTAHVSDGSVTMRWDEVTGATGYELSRSDAVDGDYTVVAQTADRVVRTTDDVDTTAVHYYRVRALDAAGPGAWSPAAVATLTAPEPSFPDSGVLRIDLGDGATAEGALALGADSAYTAESRVGFVDPGAVTATDRGTDDPLRSDFVTIGDTDLVVDVPNGDYTVDLVAGDLDGATDISLTVEQMAKVQQTALAAGELLEMSFEIAVVDGQLTIDAGGTAAKLAALTITAQQPQDAGEEPTVWVTGDSTVQSYTDDFAPQAGWGQMFDRFLSDDVTVVNKAIGGRSSKNFISQGRLDEVLLDIAPGDYLFVQFGHNDNSYGVDDRWAAPDDYADYLRTYVDGTRQRGATPVVVTPVSRRSFAADGTANVSFPAYVEAARRVATEEGVPLVDLSASSRAYLTEIGPERAKSVFLWVPAGVYPNRPDGTQDDTHFQDYGAIQMARLVATGVADLDLPLADEVVEVEPPAEVPPAPTDVVVTGVSSSGAQLAWSESATADVYQVLLREAATDGSAAGGWRLATTSTVAQAALTGLEPGVTYDVQVVATNGRGDSAPSAAQSLTTKAPLFAFDMQLPGNPVEPGYTAVDTTSAYTAEQGWGFLSTDGLGGRDRGAGFDPVPSALARDFLLPGGEQHTFVVDVADGSYAVTVYYGDQIGTARLGVDLEGRDYGSRTGGRNGLAARTLQPVEVTDGQLTVVASGWLNGMDVTALALAPTDLAAGEVDVDGTAVSVPLSWTGTQDAVGYRVYRQEASALTATAVGETQGADATAFVDTTADVGLDYTYSVVALDGAGEESVASRPLQVSTVDPDVDVAPVPAGLAVDEVAKNSVELTWEPSEGALYYLVYRADPLPGGGFGEADLVGRTEEPTWTDTDVLTTVAYRYSVSAANAGGASARSASVDSPAPTTLVRQAERLGRAPVAVATDDGVYVGWRMLGLDPDDIAFHVHRDGERVTEAPVTGGTNLLDPVGTQESTYRISTVVEGVERWATEPFQVWDDQTLDVPVQAPEDAYTKDGQPYSYRAGDASIGDVDGDGEYEVVLKWDPTNARDNSQAGYTGTVYLDAYELDGTRLWRIDMGVNIRAGAHYTMFQVYDYDGDGRAEVAMKTADGTVDGTGTVIGDAAADHRNSSGYVLTGPEYLTVFDGPTGAALDTLDYTPPRGDVGSWGDTYGNRVDRFLAGTAYLDGEHPSMVFSRGYYTRTVLAAYDFDGTELTERWVFDSDALGEQYAGQGNHQLSVNDVDGDQKDEIVFGSLTVDDDGTPLYSTGLGHGDALHVSDFDPSRPGQEVFAAHEDLNASGGAGATFRDAATGEVLWSIPATQDTGRAAMADIDPRYEGAEGWAVGGDAAWDSPVGQLRSVGGELIAEQIPAANFLTWWDGDLLREIGDHDYDPELGAGVPTIAKWDWETSTEVELYRATGTLSNNSTKGNVALQADLLGDWREEVVTRLEDSSALRIATTVDLTDVRLRTLQHDPTYRLGVAWQNTSYNQPPHTSFYLGVGMEQPAAPSIAYTGTDAGPGERVPGPATGAPAKGRLTVDDRDGSADFTITLTVAGGNNASSVTLLEDGETVQTVQVADRTPEEQVVTFEVTGKERGLYKYTAELTNQHGTTTTPPLPVNVRSAPAGGGPGRGVGPR